ncbi:MAG: polyprenyl synthetase family protein [Acidobacteria bacterium]|nr:polyprenyl synthetase family protein [Acidobacteriota bacterium]
MSTTLSLDEIEAQDQVMSPVEIFSLIKDDLIGVEQEFGKQVDDASPIVAAIVKYLLESGGKRVRPALVLLASKLVCGATVPAAIRMGAVMEMLHSATLVHDDIIDEACVRRGRTSANVKWGSNVSVLIGDWLYMTAFDSSLRERSFAILETLTSMTRLMVEGEVLQLSLIGNSHISEVEHLEIVRRKTAYMFRACAEIGALVADASHEQRRALAHYGLSAGIAFQLVDDVLDFVSTEDKLGKPVANDLREGKLTLPLIYLLQQHPEYRPQLETVMQERGFASVSREAVLEWIKQHGALERARNEARRYAEEATDALSIFPPSEYRQALLSIPRFIIERDM